MPQKNWHSGFVEANGLSLHYWRTGSDGPPVVCAHGYADHALCWAPVARVLEPRYDVVMVDARGHGLSDKPVTGYDCNAYAQDLIGLIEALDLDRPALLAHSLGAHAAAVAAVRCPSLIRSLVLEDPLWRLKGHAWAGEFRQGRANAWREFMAKLKEQSEDELAAYLLQRRPGLSAEMAREMAVGVHRLSLDAASFGDDPLECEPVVSAVTIPALLVRGAQAEDGEGEGVVTAECAAALRALNPHLEIAAIAGAGHSIRFVRLKEYLTFTMEFLQRTLAG